MTPYYADDWLQVYGGDCRAVMAELPAESVHCVVTSPPYWGLRDYGTAAWEGGDEGCDHLRPVQPRNERPKGAFHGGTDEGDYAREPNYRETCGKCGARRIDNQLGLEPTPEEYVANMVAVFREVKRVLRNDGTVWLNLGDSYASHDPGGYRQGEHLNPGGRQAAKGSGRNRAGIYGRNIGLKPKDLVGIPWRVAFALQADGWYLRSDIIWSKPNPMPESVTDRPTKSHEYLFLLSKSPRYYFDADAVREEGSGLTGGGFSRATAEAQLNHGAMRLDRPDVVGRNLRSVWTIATQPYPGAHFATFPRKLVEPCVKAGTSERGVCPECGAPWVRVVERTVENRVARVGLVNRDRNDSGASVNADRTFTTLGWRPSCAHTADPVPSVVLDPFAGSGTTGAVAQALGRRAVLIDLNPDYLAQAMGRNRDIPLGLEVA